MKNIIGGIFMTGTTRRSLITLPLWGRCQSEGLTDEVTVQHMYISVSRQNRTFVSLTRHGFAVPPSPKGRGFPAKRVSPLREYNYITPKK